MSRDNFKLAADADRRDIDCFAFERDAQGRPMCIALKHPYCLAADAKPCSFQTPRPKNKKEAESWPSQND